MLRPSEKPQLALDGENDPRRPLWLVWGVIYVVLITVLNIPKLVAWFPPASASTIIVSPLFGISFLLRDAIQHSYESVSGGAGRFRGFWVSMMFVALGALANVFYADPTTLVPSVVAFVAGSAIDGIVFSLTNKNRGLSYRLLISNVWAGPVNTILFVTLAYGLSHVNFEVFSTVIIPKIFMQILPGLIIFILGTTLFSRAIRAVDGNINRRIQRGG